MLMKHDNSDTDVEGGYPNIFGLLYRHWANLEQQMMNEFKMAIELEPNNAANRFNYALCLRRC